MSLTSGVNKLDFLSVLGRMKDNYDTRLADALTRLAREGKLFKDTVDGKDGLKYIEVYSLEYLKEMDMAVDEVWDDWTRTCMSKFGAENMEGIRAVFREETFSERWHGAKEYVKDTVALEFMLWRIHKESCRR